VIRAHIPLVIPANWEESALPPPLQGTDGACFVRTDGSMSVLMTAEDHGATKWLHVSVARRDRYPTWDELHFIKNLFIGREEDAVQILPREQDYVNMHPNCFHLYRRLDGDTVPGNPQR
jgi:hypothetical protein